MSKPLCIYHGNCADGFTAAWAVNLAMPCQFEFIAGVHQEPPPEVRGRHVLMVDFSYKRPIIEQIAAQAKSVLILDHHASAMQDLQGLGVDLNAYKGTLSWDRHLDNVQQDYYENCPQSVYTLFDVGRSGAGITWDFFSGNATRPNLVNYVEDRDLWRFNLPLSREVNAFTFAHEYTFENWDHLERQTRDHMGLQSVAEMGGAIEKKHHKDVAELVAACKRRLIIGGHMVWASNLPYTLTSDAGHIMSSGDEPFAACYWDTPEGRVFSLRSSETGMDVSEIAKQYGGGGHKHASGFRVPLSAIGQFEEIK